MPISRYDGRFEAVVSDPMYDEWFEKKGRNFFKIYRTGMLKYPTVEEIKQLDLRAHVWTYGDRYDKLASKYYYDPRLWWILAWFNKAPMEHNIKRGEIIHVPFPLEYVLDYMDA